MDASRRRTRNFAPLLLVAATILASQQTHAQCEPGRPVARLVSTHGTVTVNQRVGTRGDVLCEDDILKSGDEARAAVLFARIDSVVRIDRNTEIKFYAPASEPEQVEEPSALIELLEGAIHFFSRTPQSLEVDTPYINAGIEGTEFAMRFAPADGTTVVVVLEGRVSLGATRRGPLRGRTRLEGSADELTLAAGQSAEIALLPSTDGAPRVRVRRVFIDPADAVAWAIYYPVVLPDRDGSGIPRAGRLLADGNLQAARAILAGLPDDPEALALRAIIALARNERARALELADRAVGERSGAAVPVAARIARSYAYQASFRLQDARQEMQQAVASHPGSALAWARLAELHLSFGDVDAAVTAAERGNDLAMSDGSLTSLRDPASARTRTVLGFTDLARFDASAAEKRFEQAIALDQQDPLPRLGLGLSRIRRGELAAGIDSLLVAVALDPPNALLRSYLGKAFYSADRDDDAASELARARTLDPEDPTPWFYDAIRKQAEGRPIEALGDVQSAIEKNDNRAVYRSRLRLDEDLAARGARQGLIYRDLGFEQLALARGWRSVAQSPISHSAHRLLADSFLSLPRHEIARDSELLQSQLLQPINVNPVQPRLADDGLSFLDDTAQANVGFNEYSRLFASDQRQLYADGVVGGNDTVVGNVIHTGIEGTFSWSVGYFHSETEGVHVNNDLRQDIANAFVQKALSPRTSAQVELRGVREELGDRRLLFDPDNFFRREMRERKSVSGRVGLRHNLTPSSTVLASFVHNDVEVDAVNLDDLDFDANVKEAVSFFEVRHIYQGEHANLTGGIGYLSGDVTSRFVFAPFPPIEVETRLTHTNGYVYGDLLLPRNVTLTLGISADSLNEVAGKFSQYNPKAGLTWGVTQNTTLRAAWFRVLKRTLTSSQTLEPTHVAGFNQFFDDTNGTDAWRTGIGLDHEFRAGLAAGAEASTRSLSVPVTGATEHEDEYLTRAYLYWTPSDSLALSAEYQYERFLRDPTNLAPEAFVKSKLARVPLEARYWFTPRVFSRLRATYLNQSGEFRDRTGVALYGSDTAWVVDASIGIRLPKRRGAVSLEARNLFDRRFRFQDSGRTDPGIVSRERVLFARFTLLF